MCVKLCWLFSAPKTQMALKKWLLYAFKSKCDSHLMSSTLSHQIFFHFCKSIFNVRASIHDPNHRVLWLLAEYTDCWQHLHHMVRWFEHLVCTNHCQTHQCEHGWSIGHGTIWSFSATEVTFQCNIKHQLHGFKIIICVCVCKYRFMYIAAVIECLHVRASTSTSNKIYHMQSGNHIHPRTWPLAATRARHCRFLWAQPPRSPCMAARETWESPGKLDMLC